MFLRRRAFFKSAAAPLSETESIIAQEDEIFNAVSNLNYPMRPKVFHNWEKSVIVVANARPFSGEYVSVVSRALL
jgi:hypothetical protein